MSEVSRQRHGVVLRQAQLLLPIACCALLACQSAQRPDPVVDASAEISAGELALARGNLEDARRHFEAALGARAGSQRAWIGLARTNVASGDLDAALLLFGKTDLARIRRAGPAAFWDYCTALMGAGERRLADGRPRAALELSRRGEADGCGAYRARELLLRSTVGLADEAWRVGELERALHLYLEVLGPEAMAFDFQEAPVLRSRIPGSESPNPEDVARLRAYRGAAALLLESGRREEALSLLSGALLRFPDDTELVELMVEGLAQPAGSPPKAPR